MLSLFQALFGIFCLLFGTLLFPIQMGVIPYSASGTEGLFIIMFALMIVFMGFTPIGSRRHSWLLFILGLVLVGIGATACMAPGLLDDAISILLAAILLAKGIIRMPYFFIDRKSIDKKSSRIVSITLFIMHLFCIISGILTALLVFLPVTTFLLDALAISLCIMGVDQIILSIATYKTESVTGQDQYVASDTTNATNGSVGDVNATKPHRELLADVDISPSSMVMLFMTVIIICMIVCALLGSFGLITFDTSRSMALFVFVTAIQILVAHETPMGSFKPSPVLAILGFSLAVLVMVACIVPSAMSSVIGVIVALVNLLTAIYGFVRMLKTSIRLKTNMTDVDKKVPMTLVHLIVTGFVLYTMCLVFAINIVFPGRIPEVLLLAILCVTATGLIRITVLSRRAAKMNLM